MKTENWVRNQSLECKPCGIQYACVNSLRPHANNHMKCCVQRLGGSSGTIQKIQPKTCEKVEPLIQSELVKNKKLSQGGNLLQAKYKTNTDNHNQNKVHPWFSTYYAALCCVLVWVCLFLLLNHSLAPQIGHCHNFANIVRSVGIGQFCPLSLPLRLR